MRRRGLGYRTGPAGNLAAFMRRLGCLRRCVGGRWLTVVQANGWRRPRWRDGRGAFHPSGAPSADTLDPVAWWIAAHPSQPVGRRRSVGSDGPMPRPGVPVEEAQQQRGESLQAVRNHANEAIHLCARYALWMRIASYVRTNVSMATALSRASKRAPCQCVGQASMRSQRITSCAPALSSCTIETFLRCTLPLTAVMIQLKRSAEEVRPYFKVTSEYSTWPGSRRTMERSPPSRQLMALTLMPMPLT